MRHTVSALALLGLGACATAQPQEVMLPPPAPEPEVVYQVPEPAPEPPPPPKRTKAKKPRQLAPGRFGASVKKNATKQFEWDPTRVYPIDASTKGFTLVKLAPGEQILATPIVGSGGIQAVAMAGGEAEGVLIRMNPSAECTTVHITGSMRLYMLYVCANAAADDIVQWDDPLPPPVVGQELPPVRSNVNLCNPTRINTGYTVQIASGARPDWMPTAAYDCGTSRVWLQFPPDMAQVKQPVVMVNGRPASVTAQGNYLVVGERAAEMELHEGGNVVIVRRAS